jgi:hypothetical protein
LFDRFGGQQSAISSMTPVGVHRWNDELFVVGTSAQDPVIASIGAEGAGAPKLWQASLAAVRALGSQLEVLDDRTLPSRVTTWKNPRTATGAFPFLHAHSLHRYADETTMWLVAGPNFSVGGAHRTAIACAPAGISYP